MRHNDFERLLRTEDEQLKKLNGIVLKAIAEEKLVSEKLLEFDKGSPGWKSRIADKIAGFGGSWTFVLSFIGLMAVWIIFNIIWYKTSFDPYPFILLNLILSTIAALQAPIIMMSQNRKEEKDRNRAVNDYLINLKAEVEIRNMHEKLDLLIAEQMKTLFDIQKEQMKLMEEIRKSVRQGAAGGDLRGENGTSHDLKPKNPPPIKYNSIDR
ncbi:DUF1003 domain-containing protein [Flavitalea antarctica]